MKARQSVLCLKVSLPAKDGHSISFSTPNGQAWDHVPRKLPERLRTDKLWERLDQAWDDRHGILSATGNELGQWLFNERAALYLKEQVNHWSDDQLRLRVELRVPRVLAEYPWEIAALPGIRHLAVHPAVTVTRVSDVGAQASASAQLVCHLIGVSHQHAGNWPALKTKEEIATIREEIENASRQGRFTVEADFFGNWDVLQERYRSTGPPHIFHFAGHGLAHGGGLVFRNTAGQPQEVRAELVAQLLLNRVKGRRTQLAFLNACTTTAAGRGPFQPFGGIGDLLLQQGVPMVVGLQTPVEDGEAVALAKTFYAALRDGASVDCAVQEAREKLFFLANSGVGWAFLNLSVSGQPQPLCQTPSPNQGDAPPDLLLEFGHEEQRQRLSRFLRRKTPMVFVVHGEEGRGHRHVLERVQVDLVRVGNTLWRPVATLHLTTGGNAAARQAQLAGGIAYALGGIDDTGTPDELEDRLARTIADRCADGRVLVVDLVEELKFRTPEQADIVLTLIQNFWGKLLQKASYYRKTLPVFLLVPVAYPRELSERHPNAKKVQDSVTLTKQVIEKLQAAPRPDGNVQVEVLAELEQFTEDDVAGFLVDTLALDPQEAESAAVDIVELNDNETILARLGRFLAEWRQA